MAQEEQSDLKAGKSPLLSRKLFATKIEGNDQ